MSMRALFVLLVGLFLSVLAVPEAKAQQDVPQGVQQELDRRGMSVEEARRRARQLGIDPSNPQQAIRRARELGIPESQIQRILSAVQVDTTSSGQRQAMRDSLVTPPFPVLAGRPEIDPDSVSIQNLPADIRVRVPLRSQSQIRQVRPYFITAAGDSVGLMDVRRERGSVLDGEWRGQITIPRDTTQGTWTLFVQASTRDTSVTLTTGRRLFLLPEGELPERDERQAQKDSLRYFGYDVFQTVPQSFQPSPTGPVDDGYIVGPNDELRLTVWGGADFTYDLQVDREGRISVPNVGLFTVAGRRLEDLRGDLRSWLSQSYAGLTTDPPTVYMDLTVTRVRPVQVFVLGEVAQPGGYVVSSFASVFNALYSVGGPLKRGSLRNIRVTRNGTVVDSIDVYDYLLKGYSPSPVKLQNNDYVFIPPRGATVAIEGAVKRPAYYEVKSGETVRDLIEFAGGLKPEAYAQRFQVERLVPFEDREDPSIARTVDDYNLLDVQRGRIDVDISDGDRVRILSVREANDRVLAREIPSAKVSGAVLQPGKYQLGEGVRTVRDLIEQADGLTRDAFMEYAQLTRVNDNLKPSSRSLDLRALMQDDPTSNIVLQPSDSLHVLSMWEMEADRFVTITGQVRDPSDYEYREGMTIRDLLYKAGGLGDDEFLKDVFLERADLFRRSPDGSEERVIPFHLGDALQGDGMAGEELRPEDEIRIYPASVQRIEERFVEVSGAVKEPARLRYRDNLTLKDVIIQAGGFQEGASLQEVEITRMVRENTDGNLRASTLRVPLVENGRADSVSFSIRDTLQALRTADEFRLQHRDRVFVRIDPTFQTQKVVTVRGEVQFPGEYTLLRDNERLSNVLRRAGGIRNTGYLNGGRLIRNDEQVIIEMQDALAGDPDDDVILRSDDEIVIPPQPNTVAVRGNVANEGLIKFEPGQRVEYYLERAGGARENTEAVFVTQASGATFRVKTGWFRRTPEVDDGAIIRVTEEPEREQEPTDYGELATDLTSILSSALTVLVLATRAFD